MEVHELLDKVNDKKSFMEFAKALHQDSKEDNEKEAKSPSESYGPSANGWENGSIEEFLESAVAWTESTQDNDKFKEFHDNPWRFLGEFLHAGKVYE